MKNLLTRVQRGIHNYERCRKRVLACSEPGVATQSEKMSAASSPGEKKPNDESHWDALFTSSASIAGNVGQNCEVPTLDFFR